MSYILDALKKSEQQRRRGATPTLQEAPVTPPAARPAPIEHYPLIAAILLVIGIAAGWWRPWQTEPQAQLPPAVKAPDSPRIPTQAMTEVTAHALVATTSSPTTLQHPPAYAKNQTTHPDTAPIAVTPPPIAAPAQKAAIISLTELPLSVQQELPPMTIQLHAYSSKPTKRLVSINSRMLHEGESLAPGLLLEEITADGMILSYKGFRFQHGIR